ncbi:LutC/YkgG family protein [Benzoatithermus flavus]|uniref:LUD domain-containing protein n=1 Tax=Benzoatithermus flavus TaxID=3108223 RepID=A0ABU8XX11_9PROT
MTKARATILQAVRAALGGAPADPGTIAAEAAALLADPDAIRPRLPPGDPVAAFAERVVSPKVDATLERIDRLDALPAAVARYLAAQALPPAVALQPAPELLALDWRGLEIRRSMSADEAVGVGLARFGIAETGSLVFHSGPDTPILFNFLPLHHVVALRADRILPYLEDYAAAAASEPAPRNVNLITGISGTTDIEGSYVRGAHGPRFLHVVLVAG